jgi:hypothetical protein
MLSDLAPLHSEEWSGTIPVELNTKIGNVSVRPDFFMIDVDRAHDLVERIVGQNWSRIDRRIVHLGPERAECLPLGYAPARQPRGLCVGATHIHMDSADLERIGRIERKNSTITAFELCIKNPADSEDREEEQDREDKTRAQHSRSLLATTAWKSKRLVFSGRG